MPKLSLRHIILHRRIGLFWTGAIVGLVAPWLVTAPVSWSFAESDPQVCTVNSIYDGDTMRVTCSGQKMKIRLYCIDAPEIAQRPWGQESRDYLRQIAGKRVRVVPRTTDRYGRTVGEVWSLDDEGEQGTLNMAMILAGHAAVYRKYCGDPAYDDAERFAAGGRTGIWSREGQHQAPWVYRKR
ncbi:MAG: thermonuclease family protein [Sedimenticola sp.]